MFGKLIKHEWRATAPTQGLLALAALGVSILAGVVLRMLVQYGEDLHEIAIAGISISMVFMLLAMIGCVTAMGILLLVRFYKNKFTDEGYLTFTLPVSSHQIFLSTFVNMLIWTVVAMVVMLLGFTLFVLIGLYDPELFAPDSLNELEEILQEVKWMLQELAPETDYIITLILQVMVSVPYSIVITMTCITVGAVIAKKHKIIAAFGIYYGISYLSGIFSSIITLVLSLRNMDAMMSPEYDVFGATTQTMVVTLVWEIFLMVGGYILSTQLMKKKLNLP